MMRLAVVDAVLFCLTHLPLVRHPPTPLAPVLPHFRVNSSIASLALLPFHALIPHLHGLPLRAETVRDVQRVRKPRCCAGVSCNVDV